MENDPLQPFVPSSRDACKEQLTERVDWRVGSLATLVLIGHVGLVQSSDLRAQSPMEMALVPIATTVHPVHGGMDSLWETEFWALNDGDDAVDISYYNSTCMYLSPCDTEDRLEPGVPSNRSSTTRPFETAPDGSTDFPGVLIHYQREHSPLLHFSLRVRELRLNPASAGAAVPVVREGELLVGRQQLVNVPVGPGLRTCLRVYGPDEDDGEILVRIHRLADGRLLAEGIVSLEPSPFRRQGVRRASPDYAALPSLTASFPILASETQVVVELVPLRSTLRYWAFVSATDNLTHNVTIVTPN